MVGNDLRIHPNEQSILRSLRRNKVTRQTFKRFAHPWNRLSVKPPPNSVCLSPDFVSKWFDECTDVLKRSLIERGLTNRRVDAEIDDPHITRPPCDVECVNPRPYHVVVVAPVRISRFE